MPTAKSEAAEMIRTLIASESNIVETENADSGLTTLSFQSVTSPERHVWIDADLAGEMILDLEDWKLDGKWDCSVAHFRAQTPQAIAKIAVTWLLGGTLEDCNMLGGTQIDMN